MTRSWPYPGLTYPGLTLSDEYGHPATFLDLANMGSRNPTIDADDYLGVRVTRGATIGDNEPAWDPHTRDRLETGAWADHGLPPIIDAPRIAERTERTRRTRAEGLRRRRADRTERISAIGPIHGPPKPSGWKAI